MLEKGKSDHITLLQTVSAIAVVFLHTNGCFWQFSRERYWFTANIIESVFYFAVPVFFMITGATLINFFDRYSLRDYFVKRIEKTVLPYVTWSLFAIAYRICIGTLKLEEMSALNVLKCLIAGNAISIYWFFPPLFCVYLCMPLLAAVDKDKRNTVFVYLLIVGFVVNNLIPFIRSIRGSTFAYPFRVDAASGYLLYVIGGIVANNSGPLSKKAKAIVYTLGVGGLLLHIIATFTLSYRAGSIVSTYKGYNNVPCICYSFAVFMFLKENNDKIMKGRTGRIIRIIGRYTFPIYLMQWFIMDFAIRFFHVNTVSIVYRLGAPVVIIPIIMIITSMLRRIPIVRRTVP